MDYGYDQNTRTAGATAADGSGDLDVVTGGIGVSYDVNESLNTFGGIYKRFFIARATFLHQKWRVA